MQIACIKLLFSLLKITLFLCITIFVFPILIIKVFFYLRILMNKTTTTTLQYQANCFDAYSFSVSALNIIWIEVKSTFIEQKKI